MIPCMQLVKVKGSLGKFKTCGEPSDIFVIDEGGYRSLCSHHHNFYKGRSRMIDAKPPEFVTEEEFLAHSVVES